MGVSIRNKISAGDLDPDAIEKVRKLEKDDKTAVFMGTIVGLVHGLTYRANPHGDEPSVGFKGVFEGTPSDPNADVIQAPVLFLPGAVSTVFEQTVLGGKPRPVDAAPKRGAHLDVPTEQLQVLLELSVKKSDNARGYEYVLNIHGEQKKVAVIDGLKAMLPKRLGGKDAKTLELPAVEKGAQPSPQIASNVGTGPEKSVTTEAATDTAKPASNAKGKAGGGSKKRR